MTECKHHPTLEEWARRRPNGVSTGYTYDEIGNVLEMVHAGPGGEIARFAYAYDAAGNRLSLAAGSGSETYAFDDLNRLTAVEYSDGSSVGYGYDAAGNRTSMTSADSTTTCAYDSDGILTAVTVDGVASPVAHDDAGNVTGLGGQAFAWDAFGRLESVAGGPVAAAYSYNGDGLRARQSLGGQTAALLWDRALDIPEVVSDGDRTFLHAPGSTVSFDGAEVRYLLEDALGSARLVTDATSSTTGSAAYDPFGTVRASAGEAPLMGFAGELSDPTGLHYLRARTYAPSIGRFLSPDPVQPNAPGTQGWNRFAYAVNNPTSFVDPLGMSPFVEFSLRSAVIGGALGAASRGSVALVTCQDRPSDDFMRCVIRATAAGAIVGSLSGGFGAFLEKVVWWPLVCVGAGLFSVGEDFAFAGFTGADPPQTHEWASSFLVGCGIALLNSNFGGPSTGNPPAVPAFP